MITDSLGDLAALVIAMAVYAAIRWLQHRYPDPPVRTPRPRRRPEPELDLDEDD